LFKSIPGKWDSPVIRALVPIVGFSPLSLGSQQSAMLGMPILRRDDLTPETVPDVDL
jgi:hypothetical protein